VTRQHPKSIPVILVLMALTLGPATPGRAGAGDLDASFGVGGLVVTDLLGTTSDTLAGFARQADGRLVVAGVGTSPSTNLRIGMAVARLNLDGSLDETFGEDGTAHAGFPPEENPGAVGVAIQSDGRIVVVGGTFTPTTSTNIALARFHTDGTLDTTFGTGGRVVTPTVGQATARAVAIQSDGKIVVAGDLYDFANPQNDGDFIVVRYLSDGSLDPAFGTSGIVSSDLFGGSNDLAFDLVVRPDGRIVVCGGTRRLSLSGQMGIAQYDSSGTLDPTFGSGGVAITSFGTSGSPRAMALQVDGRVVLVGTVGSGATPALARFDASGALDPTFGVGGLVESSPAIAIRPAAVGIQSDGSILLTGSYFTATFSDFTLVRYLADGSVDLSFGVAGVVTSDFSGPGFGFSSDNSTRLLVLPDDSILVGGSTQQSGSSGDLGVARYDADGALDGSFGVGGIARAGFIGPAAGVARDVMAVQADGKVIVVGNRVGDGGEDFAVARYQADGTLDSTFGQGGIVTIDLTELDRARAVAVQGDGKIVVAGSVGNRVSRFSINEFLGVARLDADGSLDPTFGTGGIFTLDLGVRDVFGGMALQLDGRVILATATLAPSSGFNNITLVRLDPTGALDSSFGIGGLAVADFGTSNVPVDIALQVDGRIVVAATREAFQFPRPPDSFAVARFHGDGSPDMTFGTNGIVNDTFGVGVKAAAVALQPDGRVVIGGATTSTSFFGPMTLAVARYDAFGVLDPLFGSAGLVTLAVGAFGTEGRDVAVQDDGAIVVVGPATARFRGSADFAVVRFRPDGSLDADFGPGGAVQTGFGASNVNDEANAVSIQGDGRIVVAGSSGSFGNSRIAVARYEGVTSPNVLIELMVTDIELLVPEPLNNGQAKSMLVKLEGALQKIDKGDNAVAINKLEAFVNHVEAFVSGGTLDPATGAALIADAQVVIVLLGV